MSPLAKWHRSEKGLTERSVLVIFSKTRYCCPPPNFILFQVDFDVKFPLLRLLLFLIEAFAVSQLDFTLRWPWCGIVTRPPRHFMTYIYVYFKSPAVWPKI